MEGSNGHCVYKSSFSAACWDGPTVDVALTLTGHRLEPAAVPLRCLTWSVTHRVDRGQTQAHTESPLHQFKHDVPRPQPDIGSVLPGVLAEILTYPLVSFRAQRIVARELENLCDLVEIAQLARHRRAYVTHCIIYIYPRRLPMMPVSRIVGVMSGPTTSDL
jgi:hypothetical protein